MDYCDEFIDIVSVLGLAPSIMIFEDDREWAKTAILVLPGMYEEWRVSQGVKLWPESAKDILEMLWVPCLQMLKNIMQAFLFGENMIEWRK